MKILIICHEYPPIGGGGGNAAKNIARYLVSEYGDQVFLLTSRYAGLPAEEAIDGYKVFRIDIKRRSTSGSNILEWIRFASAGEKWAKNHIKSLKPDICLAFFSLPAGYIAWRLKKIYNIEYIVSLRGADVPGFLASELAVFHFLLKPLIFRIWKSAMKVVGNCNRLSELAVRVMPGAEATVILNGFDPGTFFPSREPASEKPGNNKI